MSRRRKPTEGPYDGRRQHRRKQDRSEPHNPYLSDIDKLLTGGRQFRKYSSTGSPADPQPRIYVYDESG